MPIANDKTKFSFEFTYEWESNGSKFSLPMKYMYSNSIPCVVLFLNDMTIELPAGLFTEVSDFLKSQGVSKNQDVKNTNPRSLLPPNIAKQKKSDENPFIPPYNMVSLSSKDEESERKAEEDEAVTEDTEDSTDTDSLVEVSIIDRPIKKDKTDWDSEREKAKEKAKTQARKVRKIK